MTIGEKIRLYRTKANMSQRELGEKLKISQQQIAQYENGTRNPKIKTLKKFASFFKVPLFTFTGDDLLYSLESPDPSVESKLIQSKVDAIVNDPNLTNEEKAIMANDLFTQVKILQDQHMSNIEVAMDYISKNTEKKDLLTTYFDLLNDDGQDKALEQLELLTKIPQYWRDDDPEA